MGAKLLRLGGPELGSMNLDKWRILYLFDSFHSALIIDLLCGFFCGRKLSSVVGLGNQAAGASPNMETFLCNVDLGLLLSRFSRVWLCATPQTAAHQAPPSLGSSRQKHWSGLPFPSPMHESEKWREVVQPCPTQQPHGLQFTRLLHPWEFLGKSTGVGWHCLLQYGPSSAKILT